LQAIYNGLREFQLDTISPRSQIRGSYLAASNTLTLTGQDLHLEAPLTNGGTIQGFENLYLNSAGNYSPVVYRAKSTSTIYLAQNGTYNLDTSVFVSGAAIRLTGSATAATVQVASDPGIVAGTGVTITAPVVSYSFGVSGAPVGSSIAIFRSTGSGSLIADRSQFTLASGNNSGNSTLVVSSAIPSDTPAPGFVRVLRNNGSEDRLAYSSWSGSTFTLSGTLPTSYSTGNGCYVGYLDVRGSATGNESVSLQYVADRPCVLSVRLGSGSGKIQEYRINVTRTNQSLIVPVSSVPDLVNDR